ncbi:MULTISPECIES: AGCS family amino acid carrier protein [Pseudoalteromonas]|uniref:Alanine or glycine:cation symporter, AGCS family n=1 Tax=Pseudoalteromonas peptidolytica F12-50-A1 TaxID=1315280 RepID=A0A8I0MVD5_9GAMM|nr:MULTISPECIES: AGCS family amino acid carrier protein [Pseudoalteromonas]MBE0346567.1 alanine or glycine:cation symporter, AGCS family [Pseudoalteromonas peptidolytica F12-50-A1]MDW7550695.1 AGCS family amino acid carrier protein [Pseudoalteromonas peptidolytica]NLR15378.1 amino acid carrier protein [Pseudoalteromonas peptidolytica]RXE98388.1 amino acid carrier protein [Pseudoalteromonas sp. PS5]USD29895.1 AGCS family amino acid carrier protein [Pseudoalteromonas sp. SCSIO 43201]
MDALGSLLDSLDGMLGGSPWFPYVLLGVGLFFTIYLKFPQIRYFKHACKVVTGKYDKKGLEGDTTHFQALATALSGTVGTGNIGGVALAISIGGPAALFWMWMTAFFGMTTKFVEVTLSHKYRVQTDDGTMAGGPMYYMDRRLNMKWLAVLFAIATVISSFGTGSLPQINNIAQGMEATFGFAPMATGAVLSILLALVILGGIKRIAAITSRIVPLMAAIYILGSFAVIFYNIENIVPSFLSVFTDAFTGSAAAGGFLGASFAYAFNRGVNRGLFSNEAGQGSAPIAHASAKADEPVSEGMVSILEPFIDTIIICTLTGLVILSSGVWTEKFETHFERSSMIILDGKYDESNQQDREALYAYLNGKKEHNVKPFNGEIEVVQGKAVTENFTVIHSRSIGEKVRFGITERHKYTGIVEVKNGLPTDNSISLIGHSLVHSAELTTKAFTRGYLGENGKYIVSIGLLLFAFSTAIAWSYYGDRAMIYLLGSRSVMPYRVFYVAGFFWASFADTTLVWKLAAVAIVVMTLPNLFGIFLLRKEMKSSVKDYWEDFNKEHKQ